MKCKHYEIVQRQELLNIDIQEVLKKYTSIKQWAYILHDKDDTAPHYHIYVNFGNSGIDSSLVASWFGVEEQYVSRIKGRKTDMLSYLTHSNDSQKHKHQYSIDEVVSNFDFETDIKNSKILGNFKDYSYAQQLMYIDSLSIEEKTKAFTKLEKLWKIECQRLCMNSDRKLDVIFISGLSGTGKTSYAKYFLKKLGYDYCVSSSNNDPFQDYLGQKAIILDDLRDSAFEFDDLLKILDNNTSSSVRSRFSNKVFNGSMIIITSSVPIRFWYRNIRLNGSEDMNQLYRRIGTYISCRKETIRIYDNGLDNVGSPKGEPVIIENEISKFYEVPKNEEKLKVSDIFKSIQIFDSNLKGGEDNVL